MTSVSRLRSNSEVLPGARLEYRNWVSEAFQQYQLPTLLGQDTVDPADGHTHRFQSRFLGLSSLKLGACCFSNTAFYEITESEISEIAFTDSADESPECADVLLSLSESPVNDSLAAFPSLLCTGRSPMALPPKKRKRRRVIRYDVVFCILDEPQECQVPSPDREYFLFPRDAVVEAVNDVSPFEVLFSFHLPKSSESSATISTLHAICSCAATQPKYESKLEEFAAVCSSHSFRSRNLSQRRFTDPGLQMPSVWKTESHVLNMQISGVSRDLYIAVKQTVSGFEAVCQRMMDLVRLHTERVASEKELVKEEMSLTKMEVQSQDDDMYDKHSWSSDENSWDKESNVFDDDTTMDIYMDSPHSKQQSSPPSTTVSAPAGSSKQSRPNGTNGSLKKCLYCGSKSTPMWRRGPQGAGTLCNACGVKWKHGKILCGTDAAQSMPVRDQQRRNSKPEKRRKKGATTKKDKRAKVKDKKRPLTMESEDEEMLKSIDAARNLSLNDRGRSLSSAAANSYNAAASSKEQGNASSYSVSDSCSPLDSSPNSSPPLLVHDQDRTRQSLDISIIETIGFSTESVTMSAGVDAVEAAAVLTLLKRGQD